MAQRIKIDRRELRQFWAAKRAEHERAMLRRGLAWGLVFSIPLWAIIVLTWVMSR